MGADGLIAGLLLGALLLHLLARADAGAHRLTGGNVRAPGLVSDSLYPWRYPLLVACVSVFDVTRAPLMALPALAVGFALSAAAAYVSYPWFEQPLLRPAPSRPDRDPQLELVPTP